MAISGLSILIDLDGTLFQLMPRFNQRLKEMFPEITPVPVEQTTDFYVSNLYLPEHRSKVDQVWTCPSLFKDLSLFPGALEAVLEMSKTNDVSLCTSPFADNPTCNQDKYDSVYKVFGRAWADKRLVQTGDKTRICADILIDDKPKIEGVMNPSWEHVLYDAPYNQEIKNKRRLNWQNYKKVLYELFD